MKKYIVELEFVATGRVQIEATSEDAALDKADKLKFEDCRNVSINEVSYASVIGTVEEVARMARQAAILRDQKTIAAGASRLMESEGVKDEG